MHLPPMISALRKHKSGVLLIAVEIALTLAIVCNALFVIGDRVERVQRPTGLQEADLLFVSQNWVGAPDPDAPGGSDRLDAMLQADLAALRALPGVAEATTMNTVPLLNSSWNGALSLHPAARTDEAFTRTTFYFGDERALTTLGLQLVAGRNFTRDEVEHQGLRDNIASPVVVVSRQLADALFPEGDALGQTIYINGGNQPGVIVGIVARLQTPSTSARSSATVWNSTLLPLRLNAGYSGYVVRAQPGQRAAVTAAVRPALHAVTPLRVLEDDDVRAFADIRARAYRTDIGMAVLMGIIALILIGVTAGGIVGLTSFWVGQRRRMIGVRRALGATRRDIRRYFQLENLLIAGAGALLGIGAAFGLNLWLMRHVALGRLPLAFVLVGAALMLLLGQLAVLGPALRAARVPPVVATRSV